MARKISIQKILEKAQSKDPQEVKRILVNLLQTGKLSQKVLVQIEKELDKGQ